MKLGRVGGGAGGVAVFFVPTFSVVFGDTKRRDTDLVGLRAHTLDG